MQSLILMSILGCLSIHVQAEITMHFLGTGGPEITKERQGVATLIEVPGNKFLFDAGRGVLQRMGESRINFPAVKNVFFTHLHSDHIEGLPSLWMTSWFITKRNAPMHFWGPPGTQNTITGLQAFMSHDVVARVNPVVQPSGIKTIVTEVTEGVVYQDDTTRITAIPAEHGDGNPALGYLFEHQGHSILLTGDSTYTPAFGKKIKQVDITICNVYAPSLALLENLDEFEEPIPTVVRAVSKKLASPEQAAQMFIETGAKVGVFTHNIFYDSTAEDIKERVRTAGFSGKVHIATDREYVTLGRKTRFHRAEAVPDDLEINSLNFKAILKNN
jgi:ribonuclease Z